MNTRNTAAPRVTGTYTPPGDFNTGIDVTLAGERVYVGTAFGVDLVDIATPADPVQVRLYAVRGL